MSAAVARRKKQLAAKAALASKNGSDPITEKLNQLLAPESIDESTAYEALQLAQSQVRKCVNSNDFAKATTTYGFDICSTLLTKHSKASVASQLLTLLVQVLTETHTKCDAGWITKMQSLNGAYVKAVDTVESKVEQKRLYKLHSKFLKSVLCWSEVLGEVTIGSMEIHELIANHAWFMSDYLDETDTSDATTASASQNNKNKAASGEEEDGEEFTKIALQCTAVTHYALAEAPQLILEKLKTFPAPTDQQTKANHTCPPATRDELLTRSILVMVTMENLRDAHTLLLAYMEQVETRNMDDLKKMYLAKPNKGGKAKGADKPKHAPSHVVFLSMLLSIVRKDKKTGPLYTWLLKGFSNTELAKMYKPEMLKGYTTKIGRVYFDIQPPPSMMATIENMMGMMGGAGGGGGMGGMNPAMMQAMMGGMGGGRGF